MKPLDRCMELKGMMFRAAGLGDPDYQAILRTFGPALAMLKDRPRMDMPGARPAEGVDRSCQ